MERQLRATPTPSCPKTFDIEVVLLINEHSQLERLPELWSESSLSLDRTLRSSAALTSANLEFTSGVYSCD